MTRDILLTLLKKNGRMRPHDMLQHLSIKKAALHRQLLKLQSEGLIRKIGVPPKVYYELIEKIHPEEVETETVLPEVEDFAVITPRGELLEGKVAFTYWCKKQSLPIKKTADDYVATRKKYSEFKKNGLINGTQKMQQTFHPLYIDTMYYLDFYSIERFGKTKLGLLMFYAKQNQDRQLMQKVIQIIKEPIEKLVNQVQFDAICFVPPTVKRETQFMDVLERSLHLSLPTITLEKIRTKITVPQKTLNKLPDRILNAQTTLHEPRSTVQYKHILLIDDAVGSGATMNVAAEILKTKGYAKSVTGLALTGSFSGFEVISEV